MFDLIRSGTAGREKVARHLYDDAKLKNGVRKVIGKLGANEEEFNEIFNYALVQLIKNVLRDGSFTIKTNVNSYIFGIARNLFLQKKRARKTATAELEDDIRVDESAFVDLKIINEEKRDLLSKVLDNLGLKCREVLMYWASGYKMAEIAKLLNYSSDVVVRRKKMNCLNELSVYLDANTHLKMMLAS